MTILPARTYYGWALYNEYKVTDEGLKTVSGSHVPVALSFDLDERGYTLTEYWEPRDPVLDGVFFNIVPWI